MSKEMRMEMPEDMSQDMSQDISQDMPSEMGAATIRKATAHDGAGVLALYRAVAQVPGGIARTPGEVSEAYVAGFLRRAHEDGVSFVCEEDGRIVGEIHAASLGPACFAHMLTDLTIAVAPQRQGCGIGRRLFRALLDEVVGAMPHIDRVELFARDSNVRGRALYASLGFVLEGRLRGRIIDAHGVPETDNIMAWLRPAISA